MYHFHSVFAETLLYHPRRPVVSGYFATSAFYSTRAQVATRSSGDFVLTFTSTPSCRSLSFCTGRNCPFSGSFSINTTFRCFWAIPFGLLRRGTTGILHSSVTSESETLSPTNHQPSHFSIQPQLQKISVYFAPLVATALFFVISLIFKFNWTIWMANFYRYRLGHMHS